jgi:hypothetical protein
MKVVLLVTFFILSFFMSHYCHAWDGAVSGEVAVIDVAPGNNYGFRVTLKEGKKLCGNTHTWAYLNDNDSNYQTFVAVMLAAKMSSSSVVIYSNQEKTSGNNYCHIGYISVR